MNNIILDDHLRSFDTVQYCNGDSGGGGGGCNINNNNNNNSNWPITVRHSFSSPTPSSDHSSPILPSLSHISPSTVHHRPSTVGPFITASSDNNYLDSTGPSAGFGYSSSSSGYESNSSGAFGCVNNVSYASSTFADDCSGSYSFCQPQQQPSVASYSGFTVPTLTPRLDYYNVRK